MKAATLGVILWLAAETGDSTAPTSHDLLYGTIFTGIVTICVTLITVIMGRKHTANSSNNAPESATIDDLRSEREELKDKNEELERRLNTATELAAALERAMWEAGVNPSAIIRRYRVRG